MGIPAFNIAASVTLIIAQRLARQLCKHCAEPETTVPEGALLQIGSTPKQLIHATIKHPVGCDQCKDGYKRRGGIYEVVRITKPIAAAIMDGANTIELDREAGFDDLSLEEVSRVTTD